MKHPTPWHIMGHPGDTTYVTSGDRNIIGQFENEEDAIRAVAAMNAHDGLVEALGHAIQTEDIHVDGCAECKKAQATLAAALKGDPDLDGRLEREGDEHKS